MSVSFVHLRLHTEFSLVDGLVRVKPLTKAVAGTGMPAVAVTVQSNMCSLVKFYKAAQGAGIKPICGADIWLASREEDGPLSRLTLLVMDGRGIATSPSWFPVAGPKASATTWSSSSATGSSKRRKV